MSRRMTNPINIVVPRGEGLLSQFGGRRKYRSGKETHRRKHTQHETTVNRFSCLPVSSV